MARKGFKPPVSTVVELAGVRWREVYGCYSSKIAHVIKASFFYQNGSFTVVVNDDELPEKADSPEAAAKLAVGFVGVLSDRLAERVEQLRSLNV